MSKHVHIHIGKTRDEAEKTGFHVRIDGDPVGNTIASSSSEALAKAKRGIVSASKVNGHWRVKLKNGMAFDFELNKGSTPEEVLRNLRNAVTVLEMRGENLKRLHWSNFESFE